MRKQMLIEVCIRVVDKINSNSRLDAGCTKDGDVIEALPVGSDWGSDTYANPDWRVALIDVTPTQLEALMAPEVDEFEHRQSRKRIHRLNTGAMTPHLNANPTGVVDLTSMNMNALTQLKGPL